MHDLKRSNVARLLLLLGAVALAYSGVGYFLDAIKRKTEIIADVQFYGSPELNSSPSKQQQQSYMLLLESSAVIRAALEDEAIASLPLIERLYFPGRWIRQHLTAEYLADSEMRITLTVPSNDSDQGKVLLDGVVAALVSEVQATSPGAAIRSSSARERDWGFH